MFGEPFSLRWLVPVLPPTLRRLHVVGEAMSGAPSPLLPSEEEIRELATARAYPPPPHFDTGTPHPPRADQDGEEGASEEGEDGGWGADPCSSDDDILGLSGDDEAEGAELLNTAPPLRGGRRRDAVKRSARAAFLRPPPAEAGTGSALDDPMDHVHAPPLDGVVGGVAQRSTRGAH